MSQHARSPLISLLRVGVALIVSIFLVGAIWSLLPDTATSMATDVDGWVSAFALAMGLLIATDKLGT